MGWYGNDGIFSIWFVILALLTFLGRKNRGRCQFVVPAKKSATDGEQTLPLWTSNLSSTC